MIPYLDANLQTFILKNLHIFLIRDALLDLFTDTDKTSASLITETTALLHEECWIYTGKLLNIQEQLYAVIDVDGIIRSHDVPVKVVPVNSNNAQQLCFRNSRITINKGDIVNYTENDPLETTLGRLVLNYTILAEPFGNTIPYLNQVWNISRIEELFIFENLKSKKISVENLKHYSRNLHFIGHFTELAVPSLTERALTVDPKIIARRDELLKEHAEEIANGNSIIMHKIESELVAMDIASIKGDPSTKFYDKDSKSYEIHRKMMLITGGMIPKFGEKGYSFIANSLEEGWDVKKFFHNL